MTCGREDCWDTDGDGECPRCPNQLDIETEIVKMEQELVAPWNEKRPIDTDNDPED